MSKGDGTASRESDALRPEVAKIYREMIKERSMKTLAMDERLKIKVVPWCVKSESAWVFCSISSRLVSSFFRHRLIPRLTLTFGSGTLQ